MTIHGLVGALTKELNLTPEQEFRLTAKIKRLIHQEKAQLCYRLMKYAEGRDIYTPYEEGKTPIKIGEEPPLDKFVYDTLEGKYLSHKEWSERPDEEIVTWDVGTHKFEQKIDPCHKCSKKLTPVDGYLTTYRNGKYEAFCSVCAKELGLWELE